MLAILKKQYGEEPKFKAKGPLKWIYVKGESTKGEAMREREREKGDVLECGVEGYLAEKLPEQSREHSPWIFLSSDVSDEDFKVFEYLGQHKDD